MIFLFVAGDVDLDAILGDLCQLEAQISTQQTAIDTKITEKQTTVASEESSPEMPATNKPAFSYEWDDAIDSELQDALEALNELQSLDSSSEGPPCKEVEGKAENK